MTTTIPKYIQVGLQYGLLKEGYGFKDYIQEAAIMRNGFELVAVDGVQRAGKSNCSFQIGSWAKEASLRIQRGDQWLSPGWDNLEPIDEHLIWDALWIQKVYDPANFVKTLQAVPESEPLDVLVWDDLNASYTNTTFRLDPEQYSAIDSTFTVVGTSCKVIVANIPVITRLSKNIKDNTTFEIFIGKNQMRKMMRIFRLPGTRAIDMNLFKVDVEPPEKFDIYNIPSWWWKKYEAERGALAKKVLGKLAEVSNMEDVPGYIPLTEAVQICAEAGVPWGIQSIQQMASRDIFPKQIVKNKFCVEEARFREVVSAEATARKTRKRQRI
jgi:hypothetical protein